ncbi:hypothetical protein JGU71_21650 [Antrihabitans sp. YC3-6]|uniref:Uncharacterized protein n=1 Tax=Antrihabitans stalagmiti TaxID=2799499 RepID=A0A934NUL4_9NOCA|nr:hypothetical protein [Antrihabitans stalagmiti]MBJ8341497.1 hypothetical protein [Antrihabitans stalagmiti]
MSGEPLPCRTVREFCQHYGLNRNAYLTARAKAKVNARDWATPLSAAVQLRLLRHVSVDRRVDHIRREHRIKVVTTPRRPIKPLPPPRPAIDVDAEIERMAASLEKWSRALVDLTKEHITNDGTGKCGKCHEAVPCRFERTLTDLDMGLVEEITLWEAGGGSPTSGDPEQRLRLLYAARNRWREVLVRYTVDHMLEGIDRKCGVCQTDARCEIKTTLTRINKGIARQIENDYAILDDEELNAAFRIRRRFDDGEREAQ